jgi:hypothetical protein
VLITALAWAITAGIASAVPWVLWKSRANGWALAWAVTAYFAVQETWLAEGWHRHALDWENAYWRDTGELQRQMRELSQGLPAQPQSENGDSTFVDLPSGVSLALDRDLSPVFLFLCFDLRSPCRPVAFEIFEVLPGPHPDEHGAARAADAPEAPPQCTAKTRRDSGGSFGDPNLR